MTTSEHHPDISMAAPALDAGEKGAVMTVLESGHIAAGEQLERFEQSFASYCSANHAIGTSNGTTAIHAALEALNIGPGDTVITTPFTFIATANAIRFAGGEPIFADIDPDRFTLDPASVERVIQERNGDVDAIVAVHLYGLPAEMDALADIASSYDVPLIEDAAQAHGAMYRGQPVGSIGDVGCFSFYPTKNMTTGEGGMIVTDRDDVQARARRFIDHGRSDRYEHVDVGHNFRMTDIAAAIGRVQLDRLPTFLERRRHNAQLLREGLVETGLQVQESPAHVEHAYNQFTVRCSDRDALQRHLTEFGIDTSVYYPTPVHEQPAYAGVEASAPEAERAANDVVSLPVHPGLSDADIDTILTAIEYFESYD